MLPVSMMSSSSHTVQHMRKNACYRQQRERNAIAPWKGRPYSICKKKHIHGEKDKKEAMRRHIHTYKKAATYIDIHRKRRREGAYSRRTAQWELERRRDMLLQRAQCLLEEETYIQKAYKEKMYMHMLFYIVWDTLEEYYKSFIHIIIHVPHIKNGI